MGSRSPASRAPVSPGTGGKGAWARATAPSAATNTTAPSGPASPGSSATRTAPCRPPNDSIQPGKRSGATSIQRAGAAAGSLTIRLRVFRDS